MFKNIPRITGVTTLLVVLYAVRPQQTMAPPPSTTCTDAEIAALLGTFPAYEPTKSGTYPRCTVEVLGP